MEVKRPKASDTEEDLLKLQAEFLKSGSVTSNVTLKCPEKRRQKDEESETPRDVVKMEGVEEFPSSSNPTPPKKSKFLTQQGRHPSCGELSGELSRPMKDEDVEDMIDRQDTGLAAVLTSIIERDTRNQMISTPVLGRQAFPSVLHNDITMNPGLQSSASGGKQKKKSLFAQHVEAKTAREFGVDRTAVATTFTRASPLLTPQKEKELCGPCVIDGRGLSVSNSSGEAQKIHEENVEILTSMSEADIFEEQQKLVESIDPKLLSYLKKKRQAKEGEEAKSSHNEGTQKSSFSVQKAKRNQQFGKKGEPELSFPLKPEKSWVNMDVVEKDKMEWMSELPPPSSLSSETGKPARFDFDGNLLAVDEDVPVHAGLHHHGDEPERAGYTLQELFILARSSNLQQKILSLHTLAKIIRKAKCGDLSDKTEGPVIPVLLDGGLVLLLRWSLDDSVDGVVYAAIDALHALVWNSLDEEAVDFNWPSYLGHMGVALTPSLTLEKWAQPAELDEENKEEETDGDMMKRDIVEALVRRTHFLRRFGFILDSMRPQAPVVVNMMAILCRVAQHSATMAYEIVKCAGLMDKIVREFLPTAWPVQDSSIAISDVYGFPVPCALRLVRCLAQTGKNISASMISKYNLSTVLLRFLAVDTRDLHLPILEASNLQKEALAALKVFVSYGLSTQTFFDLYEVIVHRVGKIGEDWETPVKDVEWSMDYHLASLVSVVERIVCGAVPRNSQENKKEEALHSMPVSWSHVTSLFQPIRIFVSKALKNIGGTYPVQKQDLKLLTSSLNFLASFYDVESKQIGVDEVSRLGELETLCNDCLVPFLSSYGLALMREHLCPFSNLLSSTWTLPQELTVNLPSLNMSRVLIVESGDSKGIEKLNVPIQRIHSPFAFLVSLFRLVLSACRRHKGLIPQVLLSMVNDADMLMYLKKVCQTSEFPLGSSHWTRTENFLHYLWLKACILKPCADMTLAHRVSLHLLSRLSKGDEFLVHDLMTSIVFSPSFIIEGQETHLASEAISDLSLSESLYLKSATQENINFSKSQLLREAHSALAANRGHYILALSGMEQAVMESRSVYSNNSRGVSCQVRDCEGEALMPLDWTYLPLIHVYNKATQLKSVPGSEITNKDIAMVTSVLQWTYLLEIWRPKEVEGISVTTRLSRVMCAFIAGNDMFLEKGVQKYLAGLFREMTKQKCLDRLNPEEKIPGTTSFYDLYQDFLEHYESVSFGDPVFGLYVLLPLQQRYSSLYKKSMWGEKRKILRTLRVSLQQMLIPIENFLQPEEQDVELLSLYMQALVSDTVQVSRSPVLYLVAVHHLNTFLFISYDDGNVMLRERLWKVVAANHEKHPNIIYYKHVSATSLPDGMECYDVLPAHRQDIFNRHLTDVNGSLHGQY